MAWMLIYNPSEIQIHWLLLHCYSQTHWISNFYKMCFLGKLGCQITT
uniref:Uncharacterized protein n=1 Tax=Rhizophora mucronata TaxID=61149 RepID=A0A2P2PZL7_RHIMU